MLRKSLCLNWFGAVAKSTVAAAGGMAGPSPPRDPALRLLGRAAAEPRASLTSPSTEHLVVAARLAFGVALPRGGEGTGVGKLFMHEWAGDHVAPARSVRGDGGAFRAGNVPPP